MQITELRPQTVETLRRSRASFVLVVAWLFTTEKRHIALYQPTSNSVPLLQTCPKPGLEASHGTASGFMRPVASVLKCIIYSLPALSNKINISWSFKMQFLFLPHGGSTTVYFAWLCDPCCDPYRLGLISAMVTADKEGSWCWELPPPEEMEITIFFQIY